MTTKVGNGAVSQDEFQPAFIFVCFPETLSACMACSAWNRSSIEFCFELRPLLFQISHNQKLRGGQRVKLQDQKPGKIPPHSLSQAQCHASNGRDDGYLCSQFCPQTVAAIALVSHSNRSIAEVPFWQCFFARSLAICLHLNGQIIPTYKNL